MPEAKIGVIGGSGLYEMEGLDDVEDVVLETPFGSPSDKYVVGKIAGKSVAFLARHGEGHRLLPSELNFRANIFGNGIAAHVEFSKPFCERLSKLMLAAGKKIDARMHYRGTYVCMEGPQFSTLAESELYRSWGAAVIGMTNLQEAKLAREAEMSYATLALVTDYDCWHVSHASVTVAQIIDNLHKNAETARKIIVETVTQLDLDEPSPHANALATAIITQPDYIPDHVKRDLAPRVFLGAAAWRDTGSLRAARRAMNASTHVVVDVPRSELSSSVDVLAGELVTDALTAKKRAPSMPRTSEAPARRKTKP